MHHKFVHRVGFLASLLLLTACTASADTGQESTIMWDAVLTVIVVMIIIALLIIWQGRQTPANRERYHLDHLGEHAANGDHETQEEHVEGVNHGVEDVLLAETQTDPLTELPIEAEESAAITEVDIKLPETPVANIAEQLVAPDDLTVIEGIGPKINELLHAEGIQHFEDLANTPSERLQEIMQNAGPRYRLADVSSWSEQAKLAVVGDWDALKALTEKLKAGRTA